MRALLLLLLALLLAGCGPSFLLVESGPRVLTFAPTERFRATRLANLEEAVTLWNAAMGVEALVISATGSVRVDVNDADLRLAFYSLFPGATLGMYDPKGPDILMRSRTEDYVPFTTALLHEIGHAIGLEHEEGYDSVMSSRKLPDAPTFIDAQRARKLLGYERS